MIIYHLNRCQSQDAETTDHETHLTQILSAHPLLHCLARDQRTGDTAAQRPGHSKVDQHQHQRSVSDTI